MTKNVVIPLMRHDTDTGIQYLERSMQLRSMLMMACCSWLITHDDTRYCWLLNCEQCTLLLDHES